MVLLSYPRSAGVSPDCESRVKEKRNSFGLKGIYLSTAVKDGRVQHSTFSS